MMTSNYRRVCVLALLAAWAGSVAAHPGHGAAAGFFQGLGHPIGGMDHLFAMVAVGIWSAVGLPAGRRWVGPVTFVLAMSVGAVLVLSGIAVPMLEAGVAASVVLLGLLAQASRPMVIPGLFLTAAAGLAHGMAHGVEGPAPDLFGSYALGFIATTCVLHAVGMGLGALLRDRRAVLLRITSAGITVAGLSLLVTRL